MRRRDFFKTGVLGGTIAFSTGEWTTMQSNRQALNLLALGDLLTIRTLGPFLSSTDGPYRPLLAMLQEADLTLANLEVSLSRTGYGAEKLARLRRDPALTPEIAKTGIAIVTLANNHTMDFGYDGLWETLKALDDNGISRVGAGKDLEEAMAPVTLERKGLRLSFLGFSSCLPLGAEAGEARPGVAPIRVTTAYEIDPATLQEQPGTAPIIRTSLDPKDVAGLEKAIRQAKSSSDFVVVSIHWGVAFQDRLAEYQRPLAHAMVDAGADLIIGHHPHVPHAVEVYQQRGIFYSLGNFVMQFEQTPAISGYLQNIGIDLEGAGSQETFVVRAGFPKKGLPALQIVPLVVDSQGLPRPAEERESRRILGRVRQLSGSLAAMDEKGFLEA